VVSFHYVRSDLITYTNSVIRIPSYTNNLIAGAAPVILVVFIGGYRNSLQEIHHGLLAAISGGFVVQSNETFKYIVLISIYIYSSLNRVITEALKNRVGKS
jgi:hypothetical protein